MVSCTSGFIAPYIIGVILESDAGDLQYLWKCVFYLAASLVTFGITIFVVFASARRQPWDSDSSRSVQTVQCDSMASEETYIEDCDDNESGDEIPAEELPSNIIN